MDGVAPVAEPQPDARAPDAVRPGALTALVGQTVGVSPWIEVGPERIAAFLRTVGDRAAGGAPATGPVPPLLILSLLGAMGREALPRIEGSAMGVNYGFDRVRFGAPVCPGVALRGHFVLKSVFRRTPDQWLLTHSVRVEARDGDPAVLRADWIALRVMSTAHPSSPDAEPQVRTPD